MVFLKDKSGRLRYSMLSKLHKIIAVFLIVFGTYPISIELISTNVDNSGMYFLNVMGEMGTKFGTDVMFTYGPLGFLYKTECIGNNALISLIVYATLAIVLAWLLWDTFLQFNGVRGFFLIAFATISILCEADFFSQDYYISLLVFLAISLAWRESNHPHRYLIAVTLLSIVVGLMKFNTGVQCMITLLLYVLGKIILEGRKACFYFMYPVAALVGYVLGFIVHNPSISGLFEYIHTNLEISSGYNSAMSIVPEPIMLIGAILCGTSFILALIITFFLHRKSALYMFLFSGALFQSFKHGFVRGDAHVYIFFMAFLMIITVIALFIEYDVLLPEINKMPFKKYVGITIVGVMTIVPMYAVDVSVRNVIDTIPDKYEEMRYQVPDILSKKITDSAEDILPKSILNEIGQESVAILPWELSIGAYNDINMTVMPALQSLMAYTPSLDKKNATFFEGENAPEYIVFAFYTIDYRIPLLETPATWQAIYENYDAIMLDDTYLLLKKSENPYQMRLGEPVNYSVPSTDIICLPEDNKDTLVRIKTKLTWWGKLNKLFYQVPPVDITLIYSDGSETTGRVIPEVLENGVILDLLPHTLASMGATINGVADEKSVIAFRFGGDGWDYYSDTMTVSYEPVLSEKQSEAESIYHSITIEQSNDPTVALTRRYSDVASSCWVDFINSASAQMSEIHTTTSLGLQISGWAVDKDTRTAPEAVYLKFDNKYYKLHQSERGDVAELFFGNRNEQMCGYEGWLPLYNCAPGTYNIELVILYKDEVSFDSFATKTIVVNKAS